MKRIWDFNPGFGGPIAHDRLWFYASVRSNGAWNLRPRHGLQPQRQQSECLDVRPGSRAAPASNDNTWKEAQFRVTSQLTPRQQARGHLRSAEPLRLPPTPSARRRRPRPAASAGFPQQRSVQGDWTFPATNRLLIDGG